jgi:hypothetical protein
MWFEDLKGLHYLAYLLEHPDRDIDVVDLYHEFALPDRELLERPGETVGPDEAEALGIVDDAFGSSRRLKRAAPSPESYRPEYNRLKEQLEEARENGDDNRIEELEKQLVGLVHKVKTAHGSDKGGPRDKVWRSVKKCVATAMQRIKDRQPVLWEHLKASIKIGHACLYRPRRPAAWNLPDDESPLRVPRR